MGPAHSARGSHPHGHPRGPDAACHQAGGCQCFAVAEGPWGGTIKVGSAVAADPTGRHPAGRLSPGSVTAVQGPGLEPLRTQVWAARKLCSLRPALWDRGPLTQCRAGRRPAPLLDARNTAHRGPVGLHLKGQSHNLDRDPHEGVGASTWCGLQRSRPALAPEGSHLAWPRGQARKQPAGPERLQAPEATGLSTRRQRWRVAETSGLPGAQGRKGHGAQATRQFLY